jgi:hypothetical protein
MHNQPDLQVELIGAMISRLGGQADEEYKTIPDTGLSTGPAGIDWASGTLGGFLQLRRPTVANDLWYNMPPCSSAFDASYHKHGEPGHCATYKPKEA